MKEHCDADCTCRSGLEAQATKLATSVDKLVGELVILCAESGAPPPATYQKALDRVHDLRLLAEALALHFPKMPMMVDDPRARLPEEIQVLLAKVEAV